jgi:hypothetical protein
MGVYDNQQLKESCVFAESKFSGHPVGDTALQGNYE